jgi:hypothetical protein
MPRGKTLKFKSFNDESAAACCVPACRTFPSFAECLLKVRPALGLLWALLFPVALDANDWKTENHPDSVEEVADVLQS